MAILKIRVPTVIHVFNDNPDKAREIMIFITWFSDD